MKKVFLKTMVAAGMMLAGLQTLSAQIELEHTFDGNVMYPGEFYPVINLYTHYNSEPSEVKLYNEDYSLYKKIAITPPEGYYLNQAYFFSKGIFTADNQITFLVLFTTSNYGSWCLKLYDEDGTVVKDFGCNLIASTAIHKISNDEYRLAVSRHNTTNDSQGKTEIYSLPGTATNVRSAQAEKVSSPYPNPAKATVTLPYQLKQGETSVMNIYSINGQLIESKQIDAVFNKILLNVSGYAKGTYLYEVNGVSNRFIVN